MADPGHDAEKARIAQHDRRHIEAAEGDGRGLDADQQVVIAVDHRIGRVVSNGPQHVGGQHQPRRRRHLVLHRGIRHRNAEAERNAQVGLRNRKEALEERIRAGNQHRRHRQPLGQRVERQDQREGDERQHGGHGQRLPGRDQAGGQRPFPGALDVLVEVAVGPVVDRAAGRAHQDGADHEDRHQRRRRVPIRRHPHGPQRRPQQQQRADRLVDAHQAGVERETAGVGGGGLHDRPAQRKMAPARGKAPF